MEPIELGLGVDLSSTANVTSNDTKAQVDSALSAKVGLLYYNTQLATVNAWNSTDLSGQENYITDSTSLNNKSLTTITGNQQLGEYIQT